MLDRFAGIRRRRVQEKMAPDSPEKLVEHEICKEIDVVKSRLESDASPKDALYPSVDESTDRCEKRIIIYRPEDPCKERARSEQLLNKDFQSKKRPLSLRSTADDESGQNPPVKKTSKVSSKLLSKVSVVSSEDFNLLKSQLIARYNNLDRQDDQCNQPKKAYEQYADLVRKKSVPKLNKHPASSVELPLPCTFALLLTMFKRIDAILSFQYVRHREVPFKEIQQAVGRMSPRIRLRLSHLAMIRRLFAHAYQYGLKRVDNNEKSIEGDSVTSDGKRHHLTLTFGFDGTRDYFETKLRLLGTSEDPDRGWGDDRLETLLRNADNAFAPGFLARRADIFHELLLREAKKLHGLFLEKRGICDRSVEVKRWHPEFVLSDIPFPEQAQMPEIQDHEIVSNGTKLFELAKAISSMKTRETIEKISRECSVPRSSTPISSDIPEDVIKIVGYRESKRKVVESWKETEQYQLMKLKKELPSVAMSIHESFEKKSARVLNYEHIQNQAIFHNQRLSHAAFADIAEIILRDFDGWIYMIELRSGQRYFKLRRNVQRSEFKQMLKSWITKYNAGVKEHPEFVCSMPGI
ncbi:hypothetical protein ACOME3_008456 [Neoechinorhynchus agilis]